MYNILCAASMACAIFTVVVDDMSFSSYTCIRYIDNKLFVLTAQLLLASRKCIIMAYLLQSNVCELQSKNTLIYHIHIYVNNQTIQVGIPFITSRWAHKRVIYVIVLCRDTEFNFLCWKRGLFFYKFLINRPLTDLPIFIH